MLNFFKNLFKSNNKNTPPVKTTICKQNVTHNLIIDKQLQVVKENNQLVVKENNQLVVKENNQLVVKENNQIDEMKEIKILKKLGNNLPVLHKIIRPLFYTFKDLIDALKFSNQIKEGFKLIKIDFFNYYTTKLNTECRKKLKLRTRNLYQRNILLNVIFDETNAIISDLLKFSYSDTDRLNNFKSLKHHLTKYHATEIYKTLLEEQLKICFIKIFTYENYVTKVDKNPELSKILNNAFIKYQDTQVVAELTYDIFLEYMNLTQLNFTLMNYLEFINIYKTTKDDYKEYYTENELMLDFDYITMKMTDVVQTLIEKRTYVNYDKQKLILSLLYHKIKNYDKVYSFIKELDNIPIYLKEIKKSIIKHDLLNNNYKSKQITIDDIDLMTGLQFENFLCKLLTKLNFKCEQTKKTGDQGVDIIAIKDDNKIAIQTKCYSKPVGNHAIMEVIAGSKYYTANKCMVITNSTFTRASKELANANDVILWDRNTLIEKLKEIALIGDY